MAYILIIADLFASLVEELQERHRCHPLVITGSPLWQTVCSLVVDKGLSWAPNSGLAVESVQLVQSVARNDNAMSHTLGITCLSGDNVFVCSGADNRLGELSTGEHRYDSTRYGTDCHQNHC